MNRRVGPWKERFSAERGPSGGSAHRDRSRAIRDEKESDVNRSKQINCHFLYLLFRPHYTFSHL